MNKASLYCFFAALLLIQTISSAQKVIRFRGGVNAGLVTSQVSGDGLGGWDKLGVTGGAFVSMGFNEKSSLDIGIMYSSKGSRMKKDTVSFSSFAYKLNYIDIPVLYGHRIGDLQLHIGPYVGILISQTEMRNGFDALPNPKFGLIEVGGEFGIGYWFSERNLLQIRAQTSMLPTRPAPNPANKYNYYQQGNYNQVLQLVYNYRF